jgi:hypothetical protein
MLGHDPCQHQRAVDEPKRGTTADPVRVGRGVELAVNSDLFPIEDED